MERELWQKSHEIAQCYKRYWLLLSFESDITSFVFFLDVELLNWRLLKLRYCLGHQTWENQYKVINTNIIYIYIYIYIILIAGISLQYGRYFTTMWEYFHKPNARESTKMLEWNVIPYCTSIINCLYNMWPVFGKIDLNAANNFFHYPGVKLYESIFFTKKLLWQWWINIG